MPKRDKNTKEITKDNDDSSIYSRLHDASNNKQRKPTKNTQNGESVATAKKKPNSASMMNLLQRNFFSGNFLVTNGLQPCNPRENYTTKHIARQWGGFGMNGGAYTSVWSRG
jgi:hypothetical protein